MEKDESYFLSCGDVYGCVDCSGSPKYQENGYEALI